MCFHMMRALLGTHRAGRLDELLLAQRHELGADDTRGGEPRGEGDDDRRHQEARRLDDPAEHSGDEQQRDREQHVDETHQHGVDPAAVVAGETADDRADERREQAGDGSDERGSAGRRAV